MPPSQLAIATSSLARLLKEEKTYYAELKTQKSRIQALEQKVKSNEPEPEDEEGNRAYTLKQEVSSSPGPDPHPHRPLSAGAATSDWADLLAWGKQKRALDETRNVLPNLRERITSAREKLESVLDTSTDPAEVEKAKEVLMQAKEAQKDDPDSAHPEEVV